MTSYKAIIIGGSAGSFQVIAKILASINNDFKYPVIIALHRLKHVRKGFVETLALQSNLPIIEPMDKDKIKPGNAYIAPANYHLYVELNDTFALSTEPMVHHSRPAIDLTFLSAAYVYKNLVLGIILSGANKDGAYGLMHLKEQGGTTIIQDPSEAQVDTMPKAALERLKPDYILNTEQIIEFLNNL